MGYLVSDGHWGMRGWRTSRLDPTGHSKVLVTELRAIEFMLARFASGPLTVLVDSTSALHHLRLWQQGAVDVMPAGYDLRARHGGRKPTLVRLAVRVSGRPDLTFRHVKGHSGHLLNEAADSLAKIARRRVQSTFDATSTAEDLAASFLTSWHQSAQDP
jgi:ribonuclease HI